MFVRIVTENDYVSVRTHLCVSACSSVSHRPQKAAKFYFEAGQAAVRTFAMKEAITFLTKCQALNESTTVLSKLEEARWAYSLTSHTQGSTHSSLFTFKAYTYNLLTTLNHTYSLMYRHLHATVYWAQCIHVHTAWSSTRVCNVTQLINKNAHNST